MARDLSFGTGVLAEHPAADSPARYCDEITEQVRLIESLGFTSLWIGEHHFMDRIDFDNFQLLSYLAGITSDVRLGTPVCLAPLHNPVMLAERTVKVLERLWRKEEVTFLGGGFEFEDVVKEFERYQEQFNMDYLIGRTRWPGMTVGYARQSLHRFVEDVVLHFE